MTSVSDPLVGRLLDGRYEILARLARGGMATVYRALDRRLARTVAIKVMHDGLSGDTDFAKKFDREARSAATLSSPHVVSVFDQGTDDDRPFIVMECVDGCTLRNVLVKEGSMEPLRALELFESIAAALASAHESKIVHRDVKPENVLISDRGQVKVADFGLARAVTSQTATATQGLLIGTVSYLPPELVTSGRTDARSDIYSAGIVLFEMLTGRKPYQGEAPINVAWMHVHNDIPAPSTQVDATDSRRIIPPYLDALVLACTRRQPSSRPTDGRVLLHLVRRARRAMARGVMDDPALTAELSASMRHVSAAAERTMPDPDRIDRDDDAPQGVVALDAPPRPVSHRAVSASSPSSSSSLFSAPTGPIALTSAVPPPPGRTPRSALTPIFPHMSQAPVHRRRRRGVLVLLLVLLLAIGGALGAYVYVEKQSWTSAPTLTALTQPEANKVAVSNELSLTYNQEFSESVPKGEIIRTAPTAGTRMKKGSSVIVFVSAGPERFTMPTVTGMALAGAKTLLSQNTLRVGSVTEAFDEKVAAGTVVSASQKPGAALKRATVINLVVSRGPKPIPFTSWVGKSAAQATTAMTKAGFKVSSVEEHSDTVAKGVVISQTPATGQGKKGDKVALVVSKGPQLFAIPRVVGADEATARQRLTAAGFKVAVTYNTPDWLRLNVVAGQDPIAGKMLAKGATVTIFVS